MERIDVAPGDPWLAGRRPFVRLLAEAAAALGGRLQMEAAYGHVGWFHPPHGAPRPIFGNALGLNPEAAAMLAADKDYTARLLAAEGLPTPKGRVVFAPAYRARMELKNRSVAEGLPGAPEAEAMAAQLGFPVIAKPNAGSEGRGVHRCETQSALRHALSALFDTDERVRVEECLPGEDLRLTVLDEQVRMAYRRSPPSVVGDGQRSVADLILERLDALAAQHRGAKLAANDPRIARALATAGVAPGDVPAAGHRIAFLQSANLSTGGTVEDLGAALPPFLEELAREAAGCLGLRLAGIDLLVPDLAEGGAAAHVLEVNAAPGLDYYASSGPEAWAKARALIVDALSA